MRRWRVVIQSDHHDRARCGKKLSRIGALLRVTGHPAHLALLTAPEPRLQLRPFRRQSLSARDADFVKTELTGAGFDSIGSISATRAGRQFCLFMKDRHCGQYSKVRKRKRWRARNSLSLWERAGERDLRHA